MATSTSNQTIEGNIAGHVFDTITVLDECCLKNVDCRFELVHSGYAVDAIFLSMHPQGVEVRISSRNKDVEGSRTLLSQAICCVSFAYRSAFCAFLGNVIDVRLLTSGERRVVATVPAHLTVANLRQSFRVPVVPQSGLQTVVCTPDRRKFAVLAIDISETGLEVEFNENDEHGLSIGMSVVVELKYQSEAVQRKAEVRRVLGMRCGLMIRNSVDSEDRRQATFMHSVVLSMQKLWLKSRMN